MNLDTKQNVVGATEKLIAAVTFFDAGSATLSRIAYYVNLCTLFVIKTVEHIAFSPPVAMGEHIAFTPPDAITDLINKRDTEQVSQNNNMSSRKEAKKAERKLVRLLRKYQKNLKAQQEKRNIPPGSSSKCKTNVTGTGGNDKIGAVPYGPGSDEFCLGPMTVDGDTCYLNNSYVWVVDLENGINEDIYKVIC